MPEIEETSLPGVGRRLQFTTADGGRIGVVHHRSGGRELFVCSPTDVDVVNYSLRLTDDEGHALADALGGSTLVESVSDLAQSIEGLAIDWVGVEEGMPYAGKSIGHARVRTRTGVSVVAVIRGDTAHPAPGPEFTINDGDTLVVVGTPEGINALRELLVAG